MGIQSTRWISRENAIDRINKINAWAEDKDYRAIEGASFGEDVSMTKFAAEYEPMGDISKYTDSMLSDIMDQPYYRFSMFDNYIVEPD